MFKKSLAIILGIATGIFATSVWAPFSGGLGTGSASLTSHGVVIGHGTSSITATAAGTASQPLLSGGASADPAFSGGPIKLSDGLFSAPSYSFANGTGAGMDWNNAGAALELSNQTGDISLISVGAGVGTFSKNANSSIGCSSCIGNISLISDQGTWRLNRGSGAAFEPVTANAMDIGESSNRVRNVWSNTFSTSAPTTTTANSYTVLATDSYIITNNATQTATLTLPGASSFPGRRLVIKTISAFTVVSASSNVVPQAGGAASTPILAATAGKYAELVSDGTNWITFSAN